MTIWKFKLDFQAQGRYTIAVMPRGAKVLSVGMQGEDLMLWATVIPGNTPEPRKFRVAGTGHILEPGEAGCFIGTVFDGAFVWHVFDCQMGAA